MRGFLFVSELRREGSGKGRPAKKVRNILSVATASEEH